jgi:hypothetical protein
MSFKWTIKMLESISQKIDIFKEAHLKMWNKAFQITQNKEYQLYI